MSDKATAKVAPKTAAKSAKPAEKKAAAAKAAPAKANASNGKLRVTQMVGTIARRHDQEATLRGLGLGKRHRTRELLDTPEIRGMLVKVKHLVKVEQA